MSFTEFYCNASTGDNTQAGSTEGAAVFTFANGNWNASTLIFTAAGANLSAVTVGMFAALMVDGAAVAASVHRITAVDDALDTITVSGTVFSGIAPSTSATARTIKVGGVWKGPNALEDFPFDFLESDTTNTNGDLPRTNFKNNAVYNVTGAIVPGDASTHWEGYTTTPGDGGRATIDGGSVGASFVLLQVGASHQRYKNLIFNQNGATGSNAGVSVTTTNTILENCVFSNMRGHGCVTTGNSTKLLACEAFANNLSNTASTAGINMGSSGGELIRCVSHDNTGSNTSGFRITTALTSIINCIADTNGADGFLFTGANGPLNIYQCDSYNNTGDGLEIDNTTATSICTIESCNFVKNGGYGINLDTVQQVRARIANCGFGSGTQANTSGTINSVANSVETGTVTYAADLTPWTDPADGDFRLNLAAAIGAGSGAFTQTQSGYGDPNPTVGYPDIGAAMSNTPVASGVAGPPPRRNQYVQIIPD